jgi:hypothetical protein
MWNVLAIFVEELIGIRPDAEVQAAPDHERSRPSMTAQALARTPATLVGSEIDMASFVTDVQRMTVKELASEVDRPQAVRFGAVVVSP